jgi:arginyl-tRNA synthetase
MVPFKRPKAQPLWGAGEMKEKIRAMIREAIERLTKEEVPFSVEYPANERFGDYATNVAFVLGTLFKTAPSDVAQKILKNLPPEEALEKVEVAGGGFLNFYVKDKVWFETLREACIKGPEYGRQAPSGKRVLVEFVSANPTGPLHIGHGRIAAFGDSLSRLLEWTGWQVEREFYINDMGTQMELLGASVLARYGELLGGQMDFPEDGYRGEYIYDVARRLIEKYGEKLLKLPKEEALKISSLEAQNIIMQWIREELESFRVKFDNFVSEASLHQESQVDKTLEELNKKGFLYEKDGAIWFKSTLFGDEKDRVVIRAQGTKTYFASDIAYHQQKFLRGYDLLINIWGADHHGYVKRLEAAVEALGFSKEKLKVILVQLVTLLRKGKRVSMSTRAGEFDALRDVIKEVGVDATRFFLLLRRADSPLDFDLEVAKAQNEENPVYYVQYAHARISSIFKKAKEKNLMLPDPRQTDLSSLSLPEERTLAKNVGIFPEILNDASSAYEPHILSSYLLSLAKAFHSYYNKHRVLNESEPLRNARLILVWGVKEVIRNGLEILGVQAPEEM